MKIAFAGGGTGGHISPALAMAEQVEVEGGSSLFLCSFRSVPAFAGRLKGMDWEDVCSAPLRLRAPWSLPGALAANWTGYRRSLALLKKFEPDLLVGTGGYPSVPPALAASRLGIPLVLYEANTIPGRANRFLSGRALALLRALPPEAGAGKLRQIRVLPAVPAAALAPGSEPVGSVSETEKEALTVLVMGGSHGALAVNRLVVECLPAWYGYEERLRFIHLCGEGMEAGIEAAYREAGFPARVISFTERMGELYSRADLVVSRAGAASLAELLRWGLPAVLIPYPHAAEAHQERNALCLEKEGAALVCPQGEGAVGRLARLVEELVADPSRRRAMAAAARGMIPAGLPEALSALAGLKKRQN